MKAPLNQFLVLLLCFFMSCAGPQSKPPESMAEDTSVMIQTGEITEKPAVESQLKQDASTKPIAQKNEKVMAKKVVEASQNAVEKTKVYHANPSQESYRQSAQQPVNTTQFQTKKLAVYCPKNMTYKVSSDVIGFVADLIADEAIKQMMGKRVEDATGTDKNEVRDEDMLIRELQLFQFLELRLDDSDNEGFSIKKIHDEDIQKVTVNMEGWHWKVTPTASDKEQQLVLKVIVYDENKNRIESFDKTYRIDVKIESGRFIRNTYTKFIENPEWAFTTIITPVLTFIWGRYMALRRRKKKPGDTSDQYE